MSQSFPNNNSLFPMWLLFFRRHLLTKYKHEDIKCIFSCKSYETSSSTKIETCLGDIQAKLKGLPRVQKTRRKKALLNSEIISSELPALVFIITENALVYLLGSLPCKFIWFYWSDRAWGSRAAEGAMSMG